MPNPPVRHLSRARADGVLPVCAEYCLGALWCRSNVVVSCFVRAGLYPTDTLEAAFVDAAVDAVGDNHMVLRPAVQEQDVTRKVCTYSQYVVGEGNARGRQR